MNPSYQVARTPLAVPEFPCLAPGNRSTTTLVAAVLDQGFFAAASFATNLLLGWWLPPASYGAFATSFALFLLGGGIYNAIVTEPMMVFGATLARHELDVYLSELSLIHLALCSAFGLLFFLIGGGAAIGLTHQTLLLSNLLVMAAVQPVLLYPWLIRRICYLYQRPYVAAEGGAVHLSVTLALLFLACRASQFSGALAFLIQAVGAAITTAYLCRRLQVRPKLRRRPETIRKHWNYGRWTLAAALIGWVPGNLAYLLLPTVAGLEGSGAYKALVNLVMAQIQGIASMSNVLIPSFTRSLQRSAGDLRNVKRISLLSLTGLSFASWCLLFGFRRTVLAWLYGGRYGAYSDIVPIMALLPLTVSVTIVCGALVRARQKPWGLVVANACGAAFAVTGGVFLIERYGLRGATASYAAASGITAAALYFFSSSRAGAQG
jgi:O-antigen/teichoic acid export membrane protein